MPVMLAGNDAQKKKYLGRMTEDPLMCVSSQSLLSTSTPGGYLGTLVNPWWIPRNCRSIPGAYLRTLRQPLVHTSELGVSFTHFSSIL